MDHCGESGDSERLNKGKRAEQVCRWNMPDPNWVKLNFDGSIESRSTEAGAGFIIRNDIGQPVGAGAIYLQTRDINDAELRGEWEGLCWIRLKFGGQMV